MSLPPGKDAGWEAIKASPLPARLVFVLAWLGGLLSTLMIIGVLGLVSFAVVKRYILNSPLLWGDEFIGYLLVAIVMLGAAEALRRGDHIAIDLLASRAGRAQRLWSDFAVLLVALVLGWSTWESIRFAYDFGSYSSGYIEIETWIPQVPMLIGAVLLALTALARLVTTLFEGRRP